MASCYYYDPMDRKFGGGGGGGGGGSATQNGVICYFL